MENKLRLISGISKIEIDSDSAYSIACWIGRALKHGVETHWVNHLNCDYKIEDKDMIDKMRFFFSISANSGVFDSIIWDCDQIIKSKKAAQ